MKPHRHEHLHWFADGLAAFVHEHLPPQSEDDPLATRAHSHVNGRHSHPHDHSLYEPLPAGETRPLAGPISWNGGE